MLINIYFRYGLNKYDITTPRTIEFIRCNAGMYNMYIHRVHLNTHRTEELVLIMFVVVATAVTCACLRSMMFTNLAMNVRNLAVKFLELKATSLSNKSRMREEGGLGGPS